MVEGGGEDKARVHTRAVFISYASQDAAAAARICSALRCEIRDCTLFMPVISSNTASRYEGYFRLEWDLADQRSHMMARDRAFIVPVCLDATEEGVTDVPESFHRVQWTRLLDTNTPPAFTAHIVALLSAPAPPQRASRIPSTLEKANMAVAPRLIAVDRRDADMVGHEKGRVRA